MVNYCVIRKLVRNIAERALSVHANFYGLIQKIVNFDWESKFEKMPSLIRELRCSVNDNLSMILMLSKMLLNGFANISSD